MTSAGCFSFQTSVRLQCYPRLNGRGSNLSWTNTSLKRSEGQGRPKRGRFSISSRWRWWSSGPTPSLWEAFTLKLQLNQKGTTGHISEAAHLIIKGPTAEKAGGKEDTGWDRRGEEETDWSRGGQISGTEAKRGGRKSQNSALLSERPR